MPDLKSAVMEADVAGRITLKALLSGLRRRWKWLAAGLGLGCAAGLVLAFTLPSIYASDSTISMKQNQGNDGAAGLFSKIGGLGGAVASQLAGAGGSLDKVEIILKSREIAENVVRRTGFEKRIMSSAWDRDRNGWKGGKAPETLQIADYLRSKLLKTTFNTQKQTLGVIIESQDSGITRPLVDAYLTELNEKLKRNVTEDADSNRAYLERNMIQTSDPMLREKIANILANEMERGMLLRTSMIDILEKPYSPRFPSRPNRKLLFASCMIIGLALGLAAAAVRTILEES